MNEATVLAAAETMEGPRPARNTLLLNEYLCSLVRAFDATKPALWPSADGFSDIFEMMHDKNGLAEAEPRNMYDDQLHSFAGPMLLPQSAS